MKKNKIIGLEGNGRNHIELSNLKAPRVVLVFFFSTYELTPAMGEEGCWGVNRFGACPVQWFSSAGMIGNGDRHFFLLSK